MLFILHHSVIFQLGFKLLWNSVSAITRGQSPRIVEATMDKGARVKWTDADLAVRLGRADLVESFEIRGRLSPASWDGHGEGLRRRVKEIEEAKGLGNGGLRRAVEELIALEDKKARQRPARKKFKDRLVGFLRGKL